MTINSTTRKTNVLVGNGNTATYPFAFKVFTDADVVVKKLEVSTSIETILTLGANNDYTVTLNEDQNGNPGGSITLKSGGNDFNLPNGFQIVITSAVEPLQGTDLTNQGGFFPEVINDAFDKATILHQQQQDEIDRSIKFSLTNTIGNLEINENVDARKNRVLGFDALGELEILKELGTYRGNWAAGVDYVVRDLVKDTSTNNIFFCNTAHTSSGSQPLTTNTNSANWDLIVDAESATISANNAAASATASANSASASASSASAAATSEANAASSAATSTSQAAQANTSRLAAQAAQTAAEVALDTFDDRYLGAKSSDPTVDNDGNMLIDGALYFNTTDNVTKVYDLGNTVWRLLKLSANDQAKINTVEANISNVNTVANSIGDVNTVAADIAKVIKVADDLNETVSEIEVAASDLQETTSEIDTVANAITNVDTVGNNISNVNTVAGISTDVTDVANIKDDVTAVANNNANVTTVAGDISNVNAVGSNITNVAAAGANVVDINNFADIYQISPNPPSTRADGSSLQDGDIWFNNSDDHLRAWNGTAWATFTPSQSVLDDISIVSGAITFAEDLGLITDPVTTGSSNGSLDIVADVLEDEITFVTTVISSGGNKYVIDGDTSNPAKELILYKGWTYTFDQSDNSNQNHPLVFKTDSGSYTTDVIVTGTAGQAGAKVQIKIPETQPTGNFRYYCSIHGNAMGNLITVKDDPLKTVSDNISSIVQVATGNTNVVQVASNATNINAVAAKITEIGRLGTADAVADMNTLATTDIVSDMDTLADISSDITTVANNDTNITAVANNSSNINSAVANASNINAVVSAATNINSLANNESNINAAVSNAANINTVANNIGNVNNVGGDIANVNSVAGNATNINAVNNNETNINAVNANKTNIDTVAGNNSNITSVANNESNINAVVNNATNINTVAGISSDVTTVAGISSDVSSVVNNQTNINSAVANASNINSAVANASNINTVSGINQNVTSVANNNANVTTVANSITNVNTVSSNITNVNTVASNVTNVNNFANRYRISGSAPTSNNDVGDLYFDTTSDELRVYNGTSWQGGVTASGNFAGLGANTFTGDQTINANIVVSGTVDGKDISALGITGTTLDNGVTATTQSAGDASTKVATTAYTDTAISNLVDSSPSALNTLNELAAALGDDANFSTTVTNSLATKLDANSNLNASNISSGTLAAARVGNLPASKITSGTFDSARIPTLNQDTTGKAGSLFYNSNGQRITTLSNGLGFHNLANNTGNGHTLFYNSSTGLVGYGASITNNNQLTNGAGYITSADGGNAASLDGLDSTQFCRSDSGDVLTGSVYTFQNAANEKIILQGATNPYIRWQEGTTDKAYIQWNSAGYFELVNQETGEALRIASGSNGLEFKHGGTYKTVWHSGNDGSGSGLDADTLDGVQGSSYLRSDADDVADRRITFANNSNDNEDTIATSTGYQGGLEVYNSGAGNDAFMAFHTGSDFACYFGLDADTNDLAIGGWSMGANKYKVWHAGNDGSGSGLDADTLDGQQAAKFYRETSSRSATVGGGWVTVAENSSGRRHGEIFVSDADSGDHAFIRIDWMRSYADSVVTVLNCGGHAHRITGVRVLTDSDVTYGNKKLQVYVTANSNYRVSIKALQNQDNWSEHSPVTPVVQASISGYSVQGSSIDEAHIYPLANNHGIYAGIDGIKTAGNVSSASAYVSNWFRATGASGLYFENYGGGWNMSDTTWIRAYNSKAVYVANQIAATGNVTAYYSDERLKEKTGTINNALSKVCQIETFLYKENDLAKSFGYNNNKTQVGVSAQSVEKVLPEVVHLAPFDYETAEDGTVSSKSGENYKTVDYARLVPLLIESIKELNAKIEILESKN
tara:strand:- start:3093 stop:8684 length:5592 start_codon:yes stop_codon:yes gene_type:complete